ncbi:MAG: hypothetical protein HY927_10215 [Elusimicrobia bacterium]|nr:hypothetical protein [Elusimicrobiota bacterium]
MRSEKGQFVLPTIFIFPSFFLFVFLIYDTAKLSREKIRHQFAVDSAAFVEMTNYSDFLNRSAYVNGAFPMRIFSEGFGDIPIPGDEKRTCSGKGQKCSKLLGEILYNNGAFPYGNNAYPASPTAPPNPLPSLDSEPLWMIRYGGFKGIHKNGSDTTPPNIAASEYPMDSSHFAIIDQDDVHDWWINWEDSQQIYTLYIQIWQLLGSVEEAQYSVLERLVKGHNFYKKAYWLNTGDPVADAQKGADSFEAASSGFLNPSGMKFYCHHKVHYYGNKLTGSMIPPWREVGPEHPISVDYMSKCEGGPGLFQMAWIKKSELDKMRKPILTGKYAGYPVEQPWTAPSNYFNYNFNGESQELNYGRPKVHATVSCGEGSLAAVWPNPTPKFQVRLYP